jgi:competence protein CoiA
MLSAMKGTDQVLATHVSKSDGPFACPMCMCEVLVKKGRVKIHHFAHIPPTTCSYGQGESEEHRRAKLEIFEALSRNPKVFKLKLERPLMNVRPDISFYFNGVPIAIEVQISVLPLETIIRRTVAYEQKGIYLLWVSPYSSEIEEGERYSPRQWEKYIHAMYFGKVYYWVSGDGLLPVKFAEYRLYVRESSWWEGEGHDASEVSVGGYYRYSKRYRTPQFLDPVTITSLLPKVRKAYHSKYLDIPAAKLWG